METLRTQMESVGVAREMFEVYVSLCRSGAAKASEVAHALQINRPDAYRRLDRLTEEGFANKLLSRPVRYAAVPPEEVFRVLQQRRRQELERLDAVKEETLLPLQQLFRKERDSLPRNNLRVLQGRRAIYDQVQRWIDESASSVNVATTHSHAAAFAAGSGIWETLERKLAADWDLRIILPDSPVSREHLAKRPRLHDAFRLTQRDALIRFILFDGKQLVQLATIDPSTHANSDNDIALVTEAPNLVAQQQLFFDMLWEDSLPMPQVARAPAAIGHTAPARRHGHG